LYVAPPASGPKGEKFLNDSYSSIDGVAGFSFPISVRNTGFDFKNPSWIVIACPEPSALWMFGSALLAFGGIFHGRLFSRI
jgi:hypothetical protein